MAKQATKRWIRGTAPVVDENKTAPLSMFGIYIFYEEILLNRLQNWFKFLAEFPSLTHMHNSFFRMHTNH